MPRDGRRDNTYKTHRGVGKNARNGIEDFAVAKSVVDKAHRALARPKQAADDTPAPATDQELGLDFEPSSSEGESGSESE